MKFSIGSYTNMKFIYELSKLINTFLQNSICVNFEYDQNDDY